MSSTFSDTLEQALLNHVFRGSSFTAPTSVYLALMTTAPAEDDTGTWTTGVEVSGGSYSRLEVTCNTSNWALSGNTLTSDADFDFGTASADWGNIKGVAVCSASSAGSFYAYGAFSQARDVYNGDQFKIASGNLTVTLD